MGQTKVGLVLELNGKPVVLSPKHAISEIETKGFEVELPKDEKLTFEGGLSGIVKAVSGVDIDKQLGGIPIIGPALQQIAGATVQISEFWAKLPPKAQTPPSDPQIRIGLQATMTSGIDFLGGVKLRGLTVHYASEPA